MDVDVLAIAAVTITVVLFVLLSYLGRKKNVDFGILTILDVYKRQPVSCAMCQRSGILILMPARISRQSRKGSVRS